MMLWWKRGEFIATLGSGEAFGWSEESYGKLHIQRKWADVGRWLRGKYGEGRRK